MIDRQTIAGSRVSEHCADFGRIITAPGAECYVGLVGGEVLTAQADKCCYKLHHLAVPDIKERDQFTEKSHTPKEPRTAHPIQKRPVFV